MKRKNEIGLILYLKFKFYKKISDMFNVLYVKTKIRYERIIIASIVGMSPKQYDNIIKRIFEESNEKKNMLYNMVKSDPNFRNKFNDIMPKTIETPKYNDINIEDTKIDEN